ncbi:MAG: YigZ family protein [Colwellia sp.]|nr:YigZ family protein [Colwellia sp.]
MLKEFQVAVNEVEDVMIVNRSRFICYLAPCQSPDEAKSLIKQCQSAHPQASHHCYAFLTGAPEDSQGYGFSDDGEPSGTAGRPMLAVLQGGGVGQVCAVVVRYFGGTKLGTGGLQRAYGGSVRQALTFLHSTTKIPMVHKTLACQYTQVNDILHLVEQIGGLIVNQDYLESVLFTLAIPYAKLDEVVKKLQTLSAGTLQLKPLPEDESTP